MSNVTYDDSSIDSFVGADRVRKRPAAMLGTDGIEGARHGFTEMYGNALDEISCGYGDRLDVTYHADDSVSIRDYGRGVPLGWNDKPHIKNWNWHQVYNEMYSGGKIDENQAKLAKITDWSTFNSRDFNYLFSVGLNGLGAASTQYSSEFFEVKSFRDGVVKSRSFRKGLPLVNGEPFNMFTATQEQIEAIPEEITETDEPNGTYVHWKPDADVFTDTVITADWVFSVCKYIAGVAGVDLNFKDEITGKEIYIPASTLGGLLLDSIGENVVVDGSGNPVVFNYSNMSHGSMSLKNEPFIYVCEADISIAFTKSKVEHKCFHNSVSMRTGLQYDAITDALYQFLRERVKVAGVKVDLRDFEEYVCVYVSTRSNYASLRGQTKDGIEDTMFIYTLIKDTIINNLNVEYGKGNKAVTDLINRVVEEAINRQAISNYAKTRREMDKIKREKAPEKFVSCEAYEKKRYHEAELWITEGDSAKGSVKSARNKDFQAIYPIRGKGLNVFKASIDRILKNKEIREIFSLLGTGFDLNLKGEKLFNIDDLKFDKIIFATDADEDGYQIRVLLFLTFYKLAPQLITEGHVYIAETPRFKITFSDGTHEYARNDEARDKIIEENQGRITNIARYKGLGEVNADVLRETTVHPDTRTLIPVTCDLMNETERELIDALFGADKFKQRKSIITTVLGCEVDDMFDDIALAIQDSNEEDEDLDLMEEV